MEIKNIRSSDNEVNKYVQSLEDWIRDFKASNIYRLVSSCDRVAGIIADDIDKLSEKDADYDDLEDDLSILGSKKSKIYERLLSLIGQMKNFKAIDDMVKEMKPKLKSVSEDGFSDPKSDEKNGGEVQNAFEIVSERVKTKLNGNKP